MTVARSTTLLAGLLLLVPVVGGCKSKEVVESTPIDDEFWERSERRRQAVANRGNEKPATTVALTDLDPEDATDEGARDAGNASIAQLGDPLEDGAGDDATDPFLGADTEKVTQVKAEEPRPRDVAGDAGQTGGLEDFDRQMEAIRAEIARENATRSDVRETSARATETREPALDWAGDLPNRTDVPAAETPKRTTEIDPSEFAVEDVDPAPRKSATPIPWGDLGATPDRRRTPAIESAPVEPEPFESRPGKVVAEEMIKDTIEIRPRRVSRSRNLERRFEEFDPNALTGEPPAAERLDEVPVDEIEEAFAPTEDQPTSDPFVTEGGSEFEVAMATTEVESSAGPALVAPADLEGPSLGAPTETVDDAPLPLLILPTTDEVELGDTADAAVPAIDDPFLAEFPPSAVAMDEIEFADDEPAAAPATSGNGSTTVWLFAALGLAGIVLVVRARRRLLA